MSDQTELGASEPAWPLGPLEARVLAVVWRSGEVTVRQVLEQIAPVHPVAYTTVMTVMGRLAVKGLLARTAAAGGHRYVATLAESEYAAQVTRRLARDLVDRFGDLALAQFAAALDQVDPERLRRLRDLAGQEPPG